MLKILNKRALTRRQRFINALVAGGIAAIICLITKLVISGYLGVEFSLLYLGYGWFIGMAIQKYGRGVQLQFSILAVVLTLIVIVIGDFATYKSLTLVLLVLSSLFELAIRVAALYIAYRFARVL